MCHKQRGCQSTRTVGAILRPGGKKSDPLRVAPPSFKSFSTASDAQKRRQIQNVCLLLAGGPAVLFDHRFGVRHYHYRRCGGSVRICSTGFNFDRRRGRRRQWRRVFNTPSRGEAITQGRGRWGGIRDRVARWPNLIPSFPSRREGAGP